MVALKGAEIEGFVARPDPAHPIVLLFGPDGGLVSERAEAIVKASVDDPSDPFALVRLDGELLVQDPARLVDEAGTIGLFGGRRAIWVKAGGRNIVPAVEAVLDARLVDCRVVIEAGDLRRGTGLRALCEKARMAAAIPCYSDSERDLARLVDDEVRANGLAIAPDARAALVALLGGDRRASRAELRKLTLYAAGSPRVELEDVVAVVADASALALDGIIDAAFAGRPGDVETQFAKARAAGTAASTIVGAALRQVAKLHAIRLAIESGVADALDRMDPTLHFRRKPLVEAALRSWTAERLARAMSQLAEAELETRRQADLAEAIAQRTLLSIATAGRRKA
ncbi:MAG: DNA polymerase III subunit delta [Bradyrhizobiaceae bacterium]|nr:MAG: DNA polymerase III subunit delta [Bradyrhizobiaceae bacterium]